MLRYYKTEAIILSRKNIGEADKLLTLFTREFGKKVVIAKGVRRTISRRAPYLELFSRVELLVYKGKTLDTVTEVSAKETYGELRKRLERIGFAYIGLELVERLTAENQESEIIFDSLASFIGALNSLDTKRSTAQTLLMNFKYFLLCELGFMEKEQSVTTEIIDEKLEYVLESPIKSHALLTSIQYTL